jgi:tetratricopeptide (TPR) repeat protein
LVTLALELILAALVLAATWVRARQARQPVRSVFSTLGWLLASLVVAAALYGPWVPHLRGHLGQNLGPGAARSTADAVSLGEWVKNAFFGFSPAPWLAVPFAALCLTCVVTSLRSRRLWERAWLILIWLTVPFVLIKLMDVRRYPFAKYVAYVLSVYLMGVAGGIRVLVRAVPKLLPRRAGATSLLLSVAIALSLILFSASGIRDVYAHAERDWRGAAQYLTGVASEGDVFITASLDLPTTFNQGWFSLPYYLEKAFESFYLLPAGHVAPTLDELDGVAGDMQQVWALVLDRTAPVRFDDPSLQVVPFEGDLYLVHSTRPSGSVLEDSVLLFTALASQAKYPKIEHELLLDLATMYHAAARYESANEAIERAVRVHPSSSSALAVLKGKTYHALLQRYLAAGRQENAVAIAHKLLALDAKDEDALQVLTVYDFIQEMLKAEIDAPQDFEHVDNTMSYTMPQNGDWMPVLFMHPPAEVSYPLALPQSAVELRFGVAMAPQSWEWGGDGSTFIVRLRTPDGEVHELFSQHVSNQATDQKWHRTAIDLSPFAGQDVILSFSTEPGPRGDLTGDWAGWGGPRLVWSP